MRIIFLMFLTVFVSFLFGTIDAKASDSINIYFNGEKQSYDQMPIIVDGRTFIPIRGISETYGANVWWNDTTRTVGIEKDTLKIAFIVTSKLARVNGLQISIPPSFIKNGRTMVPIRFISENMGLNVTWDNNQRAVFISSANDPETTNSVNQLKNNLPNDIISIGEKYIGVPYVYGSNYEANKTFDCSSFTQKIYRDNGIQLPRTSRQQSKIGYEVSRTNVKTGDLAFYDTNHDGVINHVAIVVDENKILHASSSYGVGYSNPSYYWDSKLVKIQRIF